eukprot:GSMAST32.ASY1.ANO1.554.1 assembled CDS
MAYANPLKNFHLKNNPEVNEPGVLTEATGDYREQSHLEISSTLLYSKQSFLPALPVPPLRKSVERYLLSLKPLLTIQEFNASKKAVNSFIQPGGMGEVLQARLIKRATEHNADGSNWLQLWWNQFSYLDYRAPIAINVSYYFHFKDLPTKIDPICRASNLAAAMLCFRHLVISGKLSPEVSGKKKVSLCSTAYKYMFNACRIPGTSGRDTVRLYDHNLVDNNTIIVALRGQFYEVKVPESSRLHIHPKDIEKLFREVIQLSEKMTSNSVNTVGILTTCNRDVWAHERTKLIVNGNIEFLHRIQRAAFIVCLDDSSPSTRDEVGSCLWKENGEKLGLGNRWYDKSLQLVVFKNGKAGLIGEHSMFDGQPCLRMTEWILHAEYLYYSNNLVNSTSTLHLNSTTNCQVSLLKPILNEDLKWKIRSARNEFKCLSNKNLLHSLAWFGFGSDFIKKTMYVSPDALIQMAIQLAYKTMFGCCRATYEPVSMRTFRHQCSTDSNPNPSNQRNEQLRLLRKACHTHSQQIRLVASGYGFERHLLGLRLLLRKDTKETADIFEDPSYWKSCHVLWLQMH